MENLSSGDLKRISKMNSQYDNKSIKIGDKHSNKVQLSIFTEGMAVTDDIKDFLNFLILIKTVLLEKVKPLY